MTRRQQKPTIRFILPIALFQGTLLMKIRGIYLSSRLNIIMTQQGTFIKIVCKIFEFEFNLPFRDIYLDVYQNVVRLEI